MSVVTTVARDYSLTANELLLVLHRGRMSSYQKARCSSDVRDILIPFSNIHAPVTMQSNMSASLFCTGGVLFRLSGTARHVGT